MSHVLLLHGDARHIPLADGSAQCIVTSPPYYGLRDYGVTGQLGLETLHDCNGAFTGYSCGDCFICHMRGVFAECYRVLRDDGGLFVNIGDSYAGHNARGFRPGNESKNAGVSNKNGVGQVAGLKPKDLCGIPQRLALALQADGWYWRQEIIWHKVNPMPESVQDRCTKAHEQVLLFSKRPRYFWDGDAIRETAVSPIRAREKGNGESAVDTKIRGYGSHCGTHESNRNARSVWSLPSESFPGAHFATMPTALATRCIQAGTPQAGCCPQCRTPWVREVERQREDTIAREPRGKALFSPRQDGNTWNENNGRGFFPTHTQTTGFAPTCPCPPAPAVPSLVVDPFCGSGTTLLAARTLGRHGVGLDLSWTYLTLARERLGLAALHAWEYGQPQQVESFTHLPLFAKEPTP